MHADQFPIKTYWFSHQGKSYAELVLTSGRSSFYIELGDNKKTYHFKKDYNHHRQAGAINNFEMALEDKSGILQWCDASYSAHLVLNVIQLDSLHLKLSFTGTVTPFANTDKSQLLIGKHLTPIRIEGKISLSKKSPDLVHLPDSYSGCNNTIYNEFSPDYSSGQYYTPTECEQSFYKKIFATLSNALSPAMKYLAAQDWDMNRVPKYKPLEHRLRTRMNDFYQKDPGGSRIDYNLDVNANFMKGAYHDYMQKILNLSKHIGSMGNIDTSVVNEIDRLQKEEPQKFKLNLQVFYNQPVQAISQLDLSHAVVKKINDNAFLIEHVGNTDKSDFHTDGSTYLFVGKWSQLGFTYTTNKDLFTGKVKDDIYSKNNDFDTAMAPQRA